MKPQTTLLQTTNTTQTSENRDRMTKNLIKEN
jgi:hypothetical protein